MATSSRQLHPASPFLQPYDLPALCALEPDLAAYLYTTVRGEQSVRFDEPEAVRLLNQALLRQQFALRWYQLPAHVLCPAVPGRFDYLLYLQDFLQQQHGKKPKATQFRLLDIGCGANLIYSLLAAQAMRWQVVASDIATDSLAHAAQIIEQNELQRRIELRHQPDAEQIFSGIVRPNELFDLTVCNPPFHQSAEDAARGTQRKQRNLGHTDKSDVLNFAGQSHELWCDGGEAAFVARMIRQSHAVASQVAWFSCLISKDKNLAVLQKLLNDMQCPSHQVIEMRQGNKVTRVLVWSWMSPAQQQLWRQYRW